MGSDHDLPTSTDVVGSVLSHLGSVTEKASHEGLTSLSGLWSELVLRDIAATVHSADLGDRCCTDERTRRHPECYEIRDRVHGCESYWRSVPSLTVHGCQFDSREQMNGASAYLDGSSVYGDTDEQLHLLRTYDDGKVEVTDYEFCNRTDASEPLRRAFLREHNRVAERLAAANVHWDDTKLFLEARRIVVAQLQHVTLNEYVPAVLGEEALTDPDLRPVTRGFYAGYSSANEGGTYDAVALTALRALAWTRVVRRDDARLERHLTASAELVGLATAPDAAAWSVHAARDHGVPGYVEFLANCLGENVEVSRVAAINSAIRRLE